MTWEPHGHSLSPARVCALVLVLPIFRIFFPQTVSGFHGNSLQPWSVLQAVNKERSELVTPQVLPNREEQGIPLFPKPLCGLGACWARLPVCGESGAQAPRLALRGWKCYPGDKKPESTLRRQNIRTFKNLFSDRGGIV